MAGRAPGRAFLIPVNPWGVFQTRPDCAIYLYLRLLSVLVRQVLHE